MLHPSMLDAAIQACIGLLMGSTEHQEPQVPFALDELSLMHDVPAEGWAWVRRRSCNASESVFDIDVCNDAGRVVLRLRGLSTRKLLEATEQSTPLMGTLTLAPLWQQIALSQETAMPEKIAHQVVIIGGTAEEQSAIADIYSHVQPLELAASVSIPQIAQRLQESGIVARGQAQEISHSPLPLHIFWLAPHDPLRSSTNESILVAQQQGVLACFRLIKALLQLGYGSQMLHWTLITRQARTLHASEQQQPTHAGLPGLFGSLAKEYPHWKIQLVDLLAETQLPVAEMLRLPADPQGLGWLYRDGSWYRHALVPLAISSYETGKTYRRGGVYVIIGGGGGLGEIWSEYVIRRYQAQVIWIGRRSKADKDIMARLEKLTVPGPKPHYIVADATDRTALQLAYTEIKRLFGQIHGVVHSAIVLQDQSLAKLDEERFYAVLAAKVDVSVRLAQIFEQEPLDFVLFFSSLNAFACPAGQSNYAAGSTFEDAFATRLRQDWSCAVKVMNWGYWGSVGAVASSEYRERMAKMGMEGLDSAEAMKALEQLLASPVDQMVVLKTVRPIVVGLAPWGEIIQKGEMMTALASKHIPSCIQDLREIYFQSPTGLRKDIGSLCLPRGEVYTPNPNESSGNTLETRQAIHEMEGLLTQLLWSHLQSLGLFRETHMTLTSLREQAGITEVHHRWLQESIAHLERQQYLHCNGQATCTVIDPTLIESAPLWQQWDEHKERWMRNGNLKAWVTLVETMLHALPVILTGKRPATEIMFPHGSMQLLEGVYQDNAISDYFNETLATLVVAYLQKRLIHDRHARIRILEIGAGTGGTTKRVLQMAQPYQACITEYCYSDISETFLRYGQQRYAAAYPYLTYQVFDVEKPLAGQGIEQGGYDLVIAANVMHATSNMQRSIRNAKALLKQYGLLLLNELSRKSVSLHLTFGLLHGWWLYEDAALRIPGCPLLAPETWQAVLEQEGFSQPFSPTPEADALGQYIIVAESNGIIRQENIQRTIMPVNLAATSSAQDRQLPQDRSEKHLNPRAIASATPSPDHEIAQAQVGRGELQSLQETLKRIVSSIIGTKAEEINIKQELSEYGFDSISFTQFANHLNQSYQLDLTPALFYEHSTLEHLAQYLQATYATALAPHLAQASPVIAEAEPGKVLPVAHVHRQRTRLVRAFVQQVSEPVMPTTRAEPIAIIGMSGMFPQAPDVQSLWHNLLAGKDCISEIPTSRWNWQNYYGDPATETNKTNVKWAGILDDIELFDPLFFGISPSEAEQMDPQQRLLMVSVWKAIEDAGYSPESLSGTDTALFVGTTSSGYGERVFRTLEDFSATGLVPSIGPNRMSYFLNLHGPSEAIETACSSSLIAIHRGVSAIESGQCKMALVGGVNTLLSPELHISFSKAGMLSSDGRCKTFSAAANGYVRGEGAGMLVLKSLSDAERDADHIYGVIIGSAENHGGRASSLTAPNPRAQADLLLAAYHKAGIDPGTVGYIEAHGTGTPLGDPIEINGLKTAWSELAQMRAERPLPEGSCGLGSLKSHIGHLELAAGVAGVIKVLLQLRHKKLVKNLHCEQINPYIQLQGSPFYIVQQNREWEAMRDHSGNTLPRRAGVSSFGFGGANAHVILEEYLPKPGAKLAGSLTPQTGPGQAVPLLTVLSATNEERLREQVRQLLIWVQAEKSTGHPARLEDVAYTLQVGRVAMEERLALQVSSFAELAEKLNKYLQEPHERGDWYRGQAKQHAEIMALLGAGEELQEIIDKWVQRGKYDKILQGWVKGLAIDWKRLYGEEHHLPHRVSLPTYSFARERHWIDPLPPASSQHIEQARKLYPHASTSLAAQTTVPSAPRTMLLTPDWKEKAITRLRSPLHTTMLAQQVVLLCELPHIETVRLQVRLAEWGNSREVKVKHWHSQQPRRELRFQDAVIRLIEEIQSLLQARPGEPALMQVVVVHREEPSILEALVSILKTAQQEYHKFWGQLIEIEGEPAEEEVLSYLSENQQRPQESHILYRGAKRLVRKWQEYQELPIPTSIPWKEGGHYLISGGAGGLGQIFIQEIARRVESATVILLGRSPLSRAQQAQLEQIGKSSIQLDYKQVDVSNGPAMHAFMQQVLWSYGHLDGIIHAAGVLRDSLLLNKTHEEVQAVLASKVSGVTLLDEESRDIPLDFFILCSSLAGVMGNVGQADYAAANGYLDAFAHARHALVIAGQRHGATVSINWPQWEAGGMQITSEAKQLMREELGIEAMSMETGMKLFHQALALRQAQVMVLHGNLPKIREHISGVPSRDHYDLRQLSEQSDTHVAQDMQATAEQALLRERTLAQMKILFAEVTKLSVSELDDDELLENYGIDSLMMTRLYQKLHVPFRDISRTLFYEYPILSALSEHLLQSYPQECMVWIGQQSQAQTIPTRSLTHKPRPAQTSSIPAKQSTYSLAATVASPQTSIAIIGISGRYPQASNLQEYWENLQAGKTCITEIPPSRWDWKKYYQNESQETNVSGKSYCKWGAFLDDFAQFDPLFFQMTPREAEEIDPQERLFLEECWKALEDAGYSPSALSAELRQRTGVFGGITKQGFHFYSTETSDQILSTSFASLVNRVSYYLNLQGPSMVVDTMCSSALVAIHEACEYIRQGKGTMALAGAVNLYVHPATYMSLSRGQMLSDSEKSAAFGRGGTGFVPGEGVGVVVLKAYDQALKDGDSIYAVIRGSAVNHKGRTKSYAAPDLHQQVAVIQQALAQQGLDPRTISYIEAAASGSEGADSVELAALTHVFGERGSEEEGDKSLPYKIGSVKSTIGHSEAASGMAQLSKVLLSLKYKMLVPTGVPEDFEPLIPFEQWPFQLQRELSAWQRITIDGVEVPRRAGITSIGVGGVNAHLIVEEHIPLTAPQSADPATPILFVLSARNKERLSAYAKQWLAYLQKAQNVDLANIAYTLQVGREAMPCRLAIIAHRQAELVHQLVAVPSNGSRKDIDSRHLPGGEVYTPNPHESSGNALEQAIATPQNIDNCYFSDKINYNGVNEYQITDDDDLSALAKAWVSGKTVPWHDLHKGRQRTRITGLPTYPFKRRICWIDRQEAEHTQEEEAIPSARQQAENKAAEFYTFVAERSTPNFQTPYLTFCPFEEKIPGFSMSQFSLQPEKYPAAISIVQQKQTEMRQVLFCQEDFQQVHTLLDIGCGHGTDIIQIAALYPHITTHGFTITQAQAELGRQRIAELNLGSQVQIFHKDSSRDAFPARYDLMLGIEVTFHIQNKKALFHNIASSLNEHGKVLLMDYITNLRGAIVDPKIEISIPTQREWLELLTEHHLVVDELIDVSPQIANFLYDPEVKNNVKGLPRVVQDMYISYANQAHSLENGWISYCLFKLKKDSRRATTELWHENEHKIAHKTPYAQALAAMIKQGHVPYPPYTAERPGSNSHQNQALHNAKAIKDTLAEIFCKVLKLQPSELNEAETFQDLGISSINVVQLTEAINTTYNLNMATSILLACSNIDALVEYLNKHLPQSDGERPGHPQGMPLQWYEHASQAHRTIVGASLVCALSRLETHDTVISDDIAIIGLSVRCAQAQGQDEFWDLVSQGKCVLEEMTQQNWLDFLQAHATKETIYRYGKMKNVASFDPLFFHISPHEAEAMDVSQRVLLEECYQALEDAGYPPASLSGQQVATIIGSMGIMPFKQDFSHFSMLGTSISILASRIAYFLNLKGPALAIDTACSSSLVAIDIACQHLKSRAIQLAIAGGITIYSHPAAFLSMSNAGMLSPTGQCRPFDHAADGIVVGDGVGVVILKRLQDAERNGDHIYGVIRASGTNQDGQTSGITVPSFQAQSQLQETIYKTQRINVEDIQYIEAHGTATKLGDPIEIHALTHAFSKFTTKKRFCGIGSLKANIGHTGAAAGVLSVIKVLLSLKHKQIPPSINFSRANEHIDFADSPVYVNTALKAWLLNARGSRLAAINSFGFSGTNAHLVLAEYAVKSQRTSIQINNETPGVFILSAANEEALRSYARAMKTFLQEHDEINLADLLYTLQVGRESMAYRLAFVVTSKEMLIAQLEQFVMGHHTGYPNRWTRKIDRQESGLAESEEGRTVLQRLAQQKKLDKLTELWLQGHDISWEGLYPSGSVKRLTGLPHYPFTREHYELSTLALVFAEQTGKEPALAGALHPLVQRNTSTLWEQQFSSTFCGNEFFLADHVVKGQRMMPGVAYLEMARAAIREAFGKKTTSEEMVGLRLSRVVWMRPLVVNLQPVGVHITLSPLNNTTISFAISRQEQEKESTEPALVSQGTAELSVSLPAIPNVDIATIQARCRRILSGTECYQRYRTLGINYGPAQRGIEQMMIGEGEVLARLRLPEVVKQTHIDFVLHPAMLDAAVQACIGLLMEPVAGMEPQLPFAMDGLEILGRVPVQGWAWVRRRQSSTTGSVLDIEVCDDEGQVTVQLRGLSTRALTGEEETRTVLLTPDWKEETIPPFQPSEEAELPAVGTEPYASRLVFLCELPGIEAPRIQSRMALDEDCELKVLSWHSSQSRQEQHFRDTVVQLMQELQHLLRSRPEAPILVQVVLACGSETSFLSALGGVLRTAQQEYPRFRGQLIEAEGVSVEDELLVWLHENQRRPQEPHIRYRDGKRWVVQWKEQALVTPPVRMPWKEGGCYLITGGAGGLARLFVQEIARQVETATVLLISRSTLSQQLRTHLEQVGHDGIHIDYQQVDVSDRAAVHALIGSVLQQYEHLDGIIHAAGVLRDSLLRNKTPQEVDEVLAPKVTGVTCLDEASAEIALDFFVLCSSGVAAVGNTGQADYAAANAYLDAFAHARRALVEAGQRHGETVSINWPLWKEGGMQIEAPTKRMMWERLGAQAMETAIGMKAFYQALVMGQAQVMVVHGRVEHFKRHLQSKPAPQIQSVMSVPGTAYADRKRAQEPSSKELSQPVISTKRLPNYSRCALQRSISRHHFQNTALIRSPSQNLPTFSIRAISLI